MMEPTKKPKKPPIPVEGGHLCPHCNEKLDWEEVWLHDGYEVQEFCDDCNYCWTDSDEWDVRLAGEDQD